MSLTHVTAARNGLADNVVDQLNSGNLVFMTSGDVEVATLALSATAFGDAAAGTATANAITDDSSATGGTIAKFKMETSANAEVFQGSVTEVGGGGDIELTSLVIGAGDTVQLTSFTYSASA